MLLEPMVCSKTGYALKPPSHFSKATEEFIKSQNDKGLRQEANRPFAPIEEPIASLSNLSEDRYVFMPGELLQFKGNGGVLLTGDHGSGKSALAIKILDNDKRWECVSCGASDVKAVDLGKKKILLGKRRSADNAIFSRVLGKRRFPLSQEEIVTIKWIIAMDDIPEDFLRQVGDYGIKVIKIDNSDVYREFKGLLQRINSAIYSGKYIDIQNASVEILSIAAMFPSATIFEVKVDEEEYEISSIGIKRIRQDLTSETIYDIERCIEIARAVNRAEPMLGETSLKEKWNWWTPNPGQEFVSDQITMDKLKQVIPSRDLQAGL